jgi:hypothetical protein
MDVPITPNGRPHHPLLAGDNFIVVRPLFPHNLMDVPIIPHHPTM